MLRTLIAESHLDKKVRKALLSGFFLPRRAASTRFISEAIADGTFRSDLSPELGVDVLYGGLLYALMVGYRTMDEAWIDELVETVIRGLRP